MKEGRTNEQNIDDDGTRQQTKGRHEAEMSSVWNQFFSSFELHLLLVFPVMTIHLPTPPPPRIHKASIMRTHADGTKLISAV